MRLIFALPILIFIVSGCSTAKVRLLQGQKGVSTIIVKDIELKEAEQTAHKTARDYCELRKSNLVILKEKSFYIGPVDSKARFSVRSATRAASLVPGSVVKDGREYQAGVMFRCQNKIFQAAN